MSLKTPEQTETAFSETHETIKDLHERIKQVIEILCDVKVAEYVYHCKPGEWLERVDPTGPTHCVSEREMQKMKRLLSGQEEPALETQPKAI